MSMLEVLIALLIFSVGLLGVVALQARMTQIGTSAEDTARAAALASTLTARMWNRNTFDLPAAEITAWQATVSDVANGGLPNATGTVTVDTPNRTADITITWRAVSAAADAPLNRYTTQVVMPPKTL